MGVTPIIIDPPINDYRRLTDDEMSRLCSTRMVSRSEFSHNGIEVEEVILYLATDVTEAFELRRLCWVREPLGEMEVDGEPNPFVNSTYRHNLNQSNEGNLVIENLARQRVRERFDKEYQTLVSSV